MLLSLSTRGSDARTARRAQEAALSALFAADGMTLDTALIPREDPPPRCTLVRDETMERQAAALLLGAEAKPTAQGGGIFTYSAGGYTAIFRAGGSFDVPALPEGTGTELCQRFCRIFSYEAPIFLLDAEGSGTATARTLLDDTPVFNCTVTFTLTGGFVTAVSGTLAPQTREELRQETPLLSALAALTAFQQMRHESSSVVSTITGIYPCYELQSTPAVPMELCPAWQIETDTISYYVNCVSGAVRRG